MPLGTSELVAVLQPGRLTQTVEVGANPIDGDPPYKLLLLAGHCELTGFEPEASAMEALRERVGPCGR
jgi:hypothetical protein